MLKLSCAAGGSRLLTAFSVVSSLHFEVFAGPGNPCCTGASHRHLFSLTWSLQTEIC